jgi:hypothetical protein
MLHPSKVFVLKANQTSDLLFCTTMVLMMRFLRLFESPLRKNLFQARGLSQLKLEKMVFS